MATTTPLTDAINALTTYANSVTGGSDTDLSSAVATLASGYGGGGGSIDEYITDTLTEYSSTEITTLKTRAFNYCANLETVSLPNVTSLVGDRHFEGCTKLKTLDLSSSKYFGNMTCLNCSSLVNLNIRSAIYVSTQSFRNCRMPTVVLPNYNDAIGQSAFELNTALTSADFKNVTQVRQYVFNGCTAFTSLIIRGSTLATLQNINAFAGTPFASGGTGGTIYVPSALISSYQSASNWSTLNGYGTVTWTAIEGSQYENYYADGTAVE